MYILYMYILMYVMPNSSVGMARH